METHPVPRLSTGSSGFTSERIRCVLAKGLTKNPHKIRLAVLYLDLYEWDLDWEVAHATATMAREGDSQARCRAFCHKLAAAMQHSTQRLELMDTWVASWAGSSYILPDGVSVDELVEHTMQILRRLPACSTAPPEYLLWHKRAWYSKSRPVSFVPAGDWGNAAVATYLDSNSIAIALHTAIQSYHIKRNPYDGYSSMSGSFGSHLNNLASILDELVELWNKEKQVQLSDCYLELLAFVWTAWQRSLTLSLYNLVRERLVFGYISEQATSRVPRLARDIAHASKGLAHATPYVCPWAFGLILANAYACSGDLRTVTGRCAEYCQELDLTIPRCIFSSSGRTRQCSGDTLEECNRFTGLHVEDQSAHTESCHEHNACAQNRLLWDPVSYNSVQGGRAISIASSANGGLLQYCSASEQTLTVSHVWSHGQGGRPDIPSSGMNGCLHERYRRLALAHGCNSYWIDTACIPSDHDLRGEAISEINRTFSDGKVTLVCDKDIMRYDIADVTVSKQERILSMLLLCDWNLRAWTFLEAMRGRNHLHLLCKNEKTVSVKSLLETVLTSGSLDLLALFADAHHLVPNRDKSLWHIQTLQDLEGIVMTEIAACLLSRRHASREGDEVVIWSLLCGGPPHETAEAFWRQHQAVEPGNRGMLDEVPHSYAKRFNTAFLVSTAPRMQIEGLRWAPTRPAPKLQVHPGGLQQAIYPEIGLGSDNGRIMVDGDRGYITKGGFKAKWNLCACWEKTFDPDKEQPWWEFPFTTNNKVRESRDLMSQIEEQYLGSYRCCALFRTITESGDLSRMLVGGDRTRELVVVAGCNKLEYLDWGSTRSPQVWVWLAVIAVPILTENYIVCEIVLT